MSHTVGPWTTGGIFDPNGPDPKTNIWGSRPRGMQSGIVVAQDVRLRDASLIAAAPDLLAACQQVLAWFDDLQQQQDRALVTGQTLASAARNWETMWDQPLENPLDLQVVKDAVAKAEGTL